MADRPCTCSTRTTISDGASERLLHAVECPQADLTGPDSDSDLSWEEPSDDAVLMSKAHAAIVARHTEPDGRVSPSVVFQTLLDDGYIDVGPSIGSDRYRKRDVTLADRLRHLIDEAEAEKLASPSRMFGGEPFPAFVLVDQLRRLLKEHTDG